MNTDYQIYFNYDNDKKVYRIPVNPEEMQVQYKGQVTSADIDKFGEIMHKGKRDAAIVSFSSFFPAKWDSQTCVCTKGQFRSPNTWIKWMQALEESSKPCHFVVTGSSLGVNFYGDVTSFTSKEVGGDPGTIQYSVEIKESRTPKVGKWVNKIVVSTPKKNSGSGSRPSNKQNPRTYTVKRGDCLWNIAKKYYGSGAQYTKIYNANRDKIKNPNLIYVGQVLKIP